ncbi:hypothetical protein LGZ99_17325 [Photorhabdus temperata]|uniref:Uncharacterized protein n=1 Tax=Photorhabdus temperata subsp. temperata Meg1 TaxID=1393735 RepID=A0A081RVZ2_PHOTE|nr:hypothetical protein [Photorhabdus temperata]KER02845.1 hypothetical protein MEG1DRAFT_02574 [Photorhabdus temperata subsp. temperata Meg1]MCT8348899.1 hypothetical protein [Photorhabdus temperata]
MSDNKRHVHADSMLEYAIDASKTDKPWKLWEQKPNDFTAPWIDCRGHPLWQLNMQYRRKPEMITVGNVSFPKPVDYKLEIGTEYWYVGMDEVSKTIWNGFISDLRKLERGRIHLAKEAVQQHFDALIKINKGEF